MSAAAKSESFFELRRTDAAARRNPVLPALDDVDHLRAAAEAAQNSGRHAPWKLYRIFGAEMSPYSVKVRSYFRYEAIPHQWILRNANAQTDHQTYAKLPIVPLVVTPQGLGIQDSTPIICRRSETCHQ